MSEICCENCICSLCINWKSCNDKTFGVEYWCYRCNDMDLDHCFEEAGTCESFIFEKPISTHPLRNEQTINEANKYYAKEFSI